MDFVRGALDATTRRLRASPEERAAVRWHQAPGPGPPHDDWLPDRRPAAGIPFAVVEALDALLARSLTPLDLVAYRGVGDADAELPVYDGLDEPTRAYLSATLDRALAVSEFAVGPRPALLRLCVPRGTRALWIPPLGWRELANEQELLLPRRTLVRYGARRTEGPLLVVSCEVIPW